MSGPKMVNGPVRAIARGYDNIGIREPGDVFEFKGPLGSWMVPIDPLDHDKDGRKGGSVATTEDVAALREKYREVFGKRPFPGWNAAELSKRIEAAD